MQCFPPEPSTGPNTVEAFTATWTTGRSDENGSPSRWTLSSPRSTLWAYLPGAASFDNSQVSPGRREDAPCGPTKAAAVREAADKLRKEGVNVAGNIDVSTAATVKSTLRSVSGIGYATSNYFLMLLGVPGIKPDRMIHRFLKDAAGHAFSNTYAVGVLRAVAAHSGVPEHELDHAIWRYESERASK